MARVLLRYTYRRLLRQRRRLKHFQKHYQVQIVFPFALLWRLSFPSISPRFSCLIIQYIDLAVLAVVTSNAVLEVSHVLSKCTGTVVTRVVNPG